MNELINGLNFDIFDIYHRLTFFDYLVFLVNFLLMIFARRILEAVYHDDSSSNKSLNRVRVFRALNLLIIFSFGYYHLYLPLEERSVGLKLVSVFVVMYLGYLSVYIFGYFVRQKFGKPREVNGKTSSVETYNSRLLSLLAGIFTFIIVLISIVQILGLDGLLEAGGVIGFVGVFLALTQAAWAPDIFSGLIILNSGMVEEGDVIQISDGESNVGIVFKTKMFHTEMLNLTNNHRIMLRNSRLRDCLIHNLSKFSSAKGLRENLRFKIAYEIPEAKVQALFNESFQLATEDSAINIETQFPLEIALAETGDHALEWVIYYYTKDVKSMIKIQQKFRALILTTAIKQGISLATPFTHCELKNDVKQQLKQNKQV